MEFETFAAQLKGGDSSLLEQAAHWSESAICAGTYVPYSAIVVKKIPRITQRG